MFGVGFSKYCHRIPFTDTQELVLQFLLIHAQGA